MEITCPRCQSRHQIDTPATARARPQRSLKFRCSHCGHTFAVDPSAPAPPEPVRSEPPSLVPNLPITPIGDPIHMIQSNGQMWTVPDAGTLLRWILELRVSRTDLVSQHGLRWTRAGDRPDLDLFFLAAERMGMPSTPVEAPPEPVMPAPVRPMPRQFSTLIPPEPEPEPDSDTVVVDAYEPTVTYDADVREGDTQEQTVVANAPEREQTERVPSRRPAPPPSAPIDPLFGDMPQMSSMSPPRAPDVFDDPVPVQRGGSGRWIALAVGAMVLTGGIVVVFEATRGSPIEVPKTREIVVVAEPEPPPTVAAPAEVKAEVPPPPAVEKRVEEPTPPVARVEEPPPPPKKADPPKTAGASTGGGPSTKSLVSQGWKAIEAGDMQKAHSLFGRALQKQGNMADALYGRGYANEKLGDSVSAASDYCDALNSGVSTDISREISAGLKRIGRSCG